MDERNQVIAVRVTRQERDEIAAASKQDSLPLAVYVRRAALLKARGEK